MKALLKAQGISDYSIFYDDETGILFAVQKVEGEASSQDLGAADVVRKWWAYMADIMETNPDQSPGAPPRRGLPPSLSRERQTRTISIPFLISASRTGSFRFLRGDDPARPLHRAEREVPDPAELGLVGEDDELARMVDHSPLGLDEEGLGVGQGALGDAFDPHEGYGRVVVREGVGREVVEDELRARMDGPLRQDDGAYGMLDQMGGDGE